MLLSIVNFIFMFMFCISEELKNLFYSMAYVLYVVIPPAQHSKMELLNDNLIMLMLIMIIDVD